MASPNRFIAKLKQQEVWVMVVRCLLLPLTVADLASLFTVIETTLRTTYAIIWAITISLTLLIVILPYTAGRIWRKRATADVDSNYLLIFAIMLAWIGTIAGISYLRFAVDIVPTSQPAPTAAGAMSSLAALAASTGSGSAAGSQALAVLLTLMLIATGAVSFCVAWVAVNPLKQQIQKLQAEQTRLSQTLEDLLALQAEYRNIDRYHHSLSNSQIVYYEAAQRQISEEACRLKQEVRLGMAAKLGDPASATALAMPVARPYPQEQIEGDLSWKQVTNLDYLPV